MSAPHTQVGANRVAQYYGYGYAPYVQTNLRWGAIAYSKATGRSGWSWEAHDQQDAEQGALQRCGTSDAQIVQCAVGDIYLALATGPTYAWGATSNADRATAERVALSACQQWDANARIVVVFHAGLGE
jgi:hypothetical protein